ncbi:hypothetical protein [Streptomyces indicus]|uniref:DUF8094 domain-containing protein n=1 Tax=Streptomyces indicus TaxID=417292 RepID=A0A1G8YMP7_9ACTN|nr:hypothetical protein [Streptomyces indicus]SDK03340.1 hypothetical protein SAMN05421806_104121 [Streptomyces indicus]
MSRVSRPAAAGAAVAALALTASGCVTVHGEREIVPAATKSEAARALEEFTAAYNKADKEYDPAVSRNRVTGPLAAINQAGLKAKGKNAPEGNPKHTELKLTDAAFHIPKKAGWPRFFVADTDSNRDVDDDPAKDTHWFLVFVKHGAEDPWKVAYLNILSPGEVPEFQKDKDGYATPAPVGTNALALDPGKLPAGYATYLQNGGEEFADGPHTSGWRADRKRRESSPGWSRQWVDQPEQSGDFAPLGLRTKDGGAFVFFAARHFEKQTASEGLKINVPKDVQALLTGEVKQSITLERVSNLAAQVPPKNAAKPGVTVASRIMGITSATGE